jgi:hypothetical protein
MSDNSESSEIPGSWMFADENVPLASVPANGPVGVAVVNNVTATGPAESATPV